MLLSVKISKGSKTLCTTCSTKLSRACGQPFWTLSAFQLLYRIISALWHLDDDTRRFENLKMVNVVLHEIRYICFREEYRRTSHRGATFLKKGVWRVEDIRIIGELIARVTKCSENDALFLKKIQNGIPNTNSGETVLLSKVICRWCIGKVNWIFTTTNLQKRYLRIIKWNSVTVV